MIASPPAHADVSLDPVVELYKQGVDMTLIRENLSKSHEERLLTLERMLAFVDEVHRAGEAMRRGQR